MGEGTSIPATQRGLGWDTNLPDNDRGKDG